MDVLPYENSLYQFGLPGRTIREAMERSVSCYEKLKIGKRGRCHFLHFSGICASKFFIIVYINTG